MVLNVLISCSSKKLAHKAKAQNLYVSPLFKYSMNYAKSLNPDRIFILSAKYGLLNPDDEIEPYNQTLNTMSSNDVELWAKRVISDLGKSTNIRTDCFVILAGEKYRTYLLPSLFSYCVPLKSMTIGKQLQFLKEHVNNE